MRSSLALLLLLLVGCTLHRPEETSSSSASAATSDVTVGMPFAGTFDRFGAASPAGSKPHHIVYGADWSSDIYAAPGTPVRFHSNLRGRVRRISVTCKSGVVADGGYTAEIDLLDAAGKKVGAANYAHLTKPRVDEGDGLEDGATLGDTSRWRFSTGCYEVSNDNGVHVHFEAAGSSCWVPNSKTDLAEGAPLARIGGPKKQQCSGGGGGGGAAPAPEPPFNPTPRPTGGPFQSLRIASVVTAGTYITQCSEDASGERVWAVSASGPERNERWADAQYPQLVGASCGARNDRHYPLVFRNHSPGKVSGFVSACVEDGAGTELVFKIDTTVDGHPAASFAFPQTSAGCP
jgi:hypothetical protein